MAVMNILFLEDEKELAATGIAQLERKGYNVIPARSVAEAHAVLDDADCKIHFMIADHRLPDGQGIRFVIEQKAIYPLCKCAVVSGCLTPANIDELEANQIPYYHKPLLYAKVIDDLRKIYSEQARARAEGHYEQLPLEKDEESTPAEQTKSRSFWPFK